MPTAAPKFRYEQELVSSFIESLEGSDSPWGSVSVGSEFFYQRGRTDVVAVDENRFVIAFEAKLARWRDALHQAYRNTCFAHRSYVLLPERIARYAHRFVDEFTRRGVGLCYIDESGGAVVLHAAAELTPVQPWLSDRAIAHVNPEVSVASPD